MHGCRTCLSRYDLSPLFSEQGVVKFSSDELLSVTGVKIEPNDGLPQSACATCIKQISRTLELRGMSSKVDRMLRSIMIKYGTIIKTEQNHNTLQNLLDPSSNENILFCKDIKQEFTKAFCPSDHDHNYDNKSSLIEHTEINTSQSHNYDRNKIQTNDLEISDRYDIDVHDSNGNSDASDTSPIIEMIDKSLDNNVNHSKDNILTDDNDSFRQSNDINAITSNIFEPEIFLSTQSEMVKVDSTKNTRKTSSNVTDVKEKKCLTMKYNMKITKAKLTQEESPSSKSDLARGKLSDLQIENFVSEKELDELFKDNVSGRYTNSLDAHLKNIVTEKELITLFGETYTGRNTRSNASNTNKSKDNGSNRHILSLTKEDLTVNKKSNFKKDSADFNKIKLDNYKNYVKYHMMIPHPPNGPFQCKLCYIKLSSLKKLRYHAKRHFEPEFPCDKCAKKFYCRNLLSYHQQRMHDKEKRLSCPHCDYKTVDRLTLRIHQLEHTGERPYICNECGANFRSRTVLVQHMTIKHFGVKKFQCEICSAMFNHQSRLWGHRVNHFMKYTYFCYMCPRTYTGTSLVKKHLFKEHGVPFNEHRKIKFIKTKRVKTKNGSTNITEKSTEHTAK